MNVSRGGETDAAHGATVIPAMCYDMHEHFGAGHASRFAVSKDELYGLLQLIFSKSREVALIPAVGNSHCVM